MTWFGWALIIYILILNAADIFMIGETVRITKGPVATLTIINFLIIFGLITVGV